MLVRTLLIWLLALALPAQGVSAATMAFCGQAHHRVAAAAQAEPHPADAHAHHAGHTMAAAGHDAAAAAIEPGASGPAAAADAHGCSACASCCSAGALLNAVPTVPAPERGPAVFAAVVASIDTPVADGLERPPRSDLA